MKLFVNVFNFSPTKVNHLSIFELSMLFFQQTIVYCSFGLAFIFFLTILITKINNHSLKFNSLFNLIKYANILCLSIIFVLIFCKFIIYLWNYKRLNLFISLFPSTNMSLNYLFGNLSLTLNNSILSDVVVLLAFSSGLVCLYLLGEKNLSKYLSNISIFAIFLVAIITMVYTANLLVMFLGFELLFLPTLYFVYSHGYMQRADKTLKILLYWTLFGAFLIFTSMGYLYIKYKTLNYFTLSQLNFSYYEQLFLYIFIFIGFGIKVPVFPFHYWLTKIHVEAPAGFFNFFKWFFSKSCDLLFLLF